MKRAQWTSAWAATVLGGLWLGLFPLLSRFSYTGITRSKWEIAMALGAFTLGAGAMLFACGTWRQVKWLRPGRGLMALFFLWVALSAEFGSAADLLNQNGERVVWVGAGRYEGLPTQLCYGAIFLTLSLLRPKMKAVSCCAAAGLLCMLGVTLGQYAGYNVLGFYPGRLSVRTNYEFQSTLGNIDMVAGVLAVLVPLTLGEWIHSGGRRGALLLPAGLGGVLMLLMMEVQSGLLALLCALWLLCGLLLRCPECRARGMAVLCGVMACVSLRLLLGLPWLDGLQAPWNLPTRPDAPLPLLSGTEPVVFPWHPVWWKFVPLLLCAPLGFLGARWRKRPGAATPLWLTLLLLALSVAFVLLLVALVEVPASAGGLWELHEVLCGRAQDSFGSERLGVWRCTLEIARQHPLFGTGPDTFLAVMSGYLKENGLRFRQLFDSPHNMLLAILVQNGAPALALFVLGMAALIVSSARKKEGRALAAALLCFLTQGLFSFSLAIVSPIFWAAAGLAAGLDGTRQPEKKGRCS